MSEQRTDSGKRPSRRREDREPREPQEFEQKILDLARVTRVTAGGKRMRFRACVAIGDRKGRVAVGLAKGADVSSAIAKATTQAKKVLVTVPMRHETIPFDVGVKFKASKVLLKPAPKGTGIIAGGVVRLILDLSGIPNVVAKMLGSSNRVTNAKATMCAIRALRDQHEIARARRSMRAAAASRASAAA
ncbi:30S ribosomal protein S5 [Candidatus Uhrbacteria bacterium]|nr:30S ribosomal protein S5 [Candidatus Uhrbacteria bacterium]